MDNIEIYIVFEDLIERLRILVSSTLSRPVKLKQRNQVLERLPEVENKGEILTGEQPTWGNLSQTKTPLQTEAELTTLLQFNHFYYLLAFLQEPIVLEFVIDSVLILPRTSLDIDLKWESQIIQYKVEDRKKHAEPEISEFSSFNFSE